MMEIHLDYTLKIMKHDSISTSSPKTYKIRTVNRIKCFSKATFLPNDVFYTSPLSGDIYRHTLIISNTHN